MRIRILLTSVTALAFLLCGALFGITPHAFAQTGAGCGNSTQARNEVATDQRMLAEMSTNDPAAINRNFNKYSAGVTFMRNLLKHPEPAIAPWAEKRRTEKLAVLEDALDFWREKKANLASEGAVAVQAGGRWVSALRADIARCQGTQRSSPPARSTQSSPKYRWNGTWSDGPYVIQISGGFGQLTYEFLRSEGDGSLVDKGKGTCEVHGSEATCTEDAHYHDSDKDVERSSDVTLTLTGDTISAKSKVKTATVTLASGQPCPDPAQCTSMHPGAEFSGYWTRTKP